VVAVN